VRNAVLTDTSSAAESAGQCEYYNISQAANALGVSRVSIWRWIRDGHLPAARIGHRTTRIKREDLEAMLLRLQAGQARPWVTRRRGTPASPNAAENGHAPRIHWSDMGPAEHFVQLYDTDTCLLDAVADFLGAGLRAGDAGIAIATTAHLAGIAERLQAAGLDTTAARASGQYVELDAAETLARFMVAGAPDRERFATVVGSVVERAAANGRGVRAFGEMVALLAADGQHEATVALETLWNDLHRRHAFALFCAYPMEGLGGEAGAALLEHVCAEHSRTIPTESYTALPTADRRLREIAALQQKAQSLRAEIAERQRAEARLREALEAERAAREAAERALRLRDEFLSVAAHELKTPLASLSGQAQLALRRLAREGQLDPERSNQALRTITTQAHKLGRLVNQLFDVSRLESGKLALERQPTDLAALVDQAVSNARARGSEHALAVAAPPSLVALVDPLRVEQVLTNLLDNAIKYSPDGGPIEVRLARLDDAVVELTVRDRGLGIPPERRAAIFERFYQGHEEQHRSGLGLGLYVCRQIVDLHGGVIAVEFPADGGTRFVVRLPIVGATSAEPTVEAQSHAAVAS
jgi:excisionase family DNA binding protein